MRYILVVAIVVAFSSKAIAASSDEGVISQLYTGSTGNMAIKLDSGFPNAVAANQCSTGNGWAGVSSTASSTIKSALLAAKTSGSVVVVVTEGCEAGGAWLKVTAVYLN